MRYAFRMPARTSGSAVVPLAFAFASVVAPVAAAQDAPQSVAADQAARTDESYHVEFGADAWFARLLGDVTLGAGARRDIKALDLRDSEAAFAGHARISRDRCFAEIAGFSFDTDGSYSSGGDDFQSDFTWWGVSADIGYALFTPFADQTTPWSDPTFDHYGGNVNEDKSYRLDLRISPTLGVTYHDVGIDDRNITQATLQSIDGGWMAVRVGAEIEMRLRPGADFSFLKEIIIGAQISAGPMMGVSGDADGAGMAVELEAGAKFMFTENIGANLGYRLTDAEFDGSATSGDMEIGVYGLFAGVSIRF